MAEKDWYEIDELANMWNLPVARVRSIVAALEPIGAIITRDKPGDRRYKQISKDSIETLRKSALGY